MRIGVLEWDISALGGRHRTMLAFADYFLSAGHDVTFYSSFTEQRDGFTKTTCLDWFRCEHLQYSHLRFLDLQRRYTKDSIPDEWKKLDVLLVPYGGYGHLQPLLPGVRVITWVIHPEQARSLSVGEVWTNSETTLGRLTDSERWADSSPTIVFPPHDYTMFRQHSRPWGRRDIDVLAVGSFVHAKGLTDFSAMVAEHGIRGAIIGSCWRAAAVENREVEAILEAGPCAIHRNLRGDEVARLMGRSKNLVSYSRQESAPLVYYEAMNAGCRVLSLNVGAAQEQVGSTGIVCPDPESLTKAVGDNWDIAPARPQERGLQFDRSRCGDRVLKALRIR